MASEGGFERKTLTLDELLEELRDVVLDADPKDLDAMKLRYDELHRRALELAKGRRC